MTRDRPPEAGDGSGGIQPPELPPPYLWERVLPGIVRRVRREADLSQRELAKQAGVAASTVGRIEAGTLVPSFRMLLRLLAPARFILVVADETGRVIRPLYVWDDTRDGADRNFPAHLDLILDPTDGDDWWGATYGLARPPETYHRSRAYRDAKRNRSQWEVRVKQFRNDPPPREPGPAPWR
nr:helix-turn-helix transcriptional regulator [Phytoactinopolyspora alkaliphila]